MSGTQFASAGSRNARSTLAGVSPSRTSGLFTITLPVVELDEVVAGDARVDGEGRGDEREGDGGGEAPASSAGRERRGPQASWLLSRRWRACQPSALA